MDEALTLEFFTPFVGRQFSFEGQPVTLRLASVDPKPRFAMPNAARVPFLLLFHGPIDTILPQGIYRAAIQDGPIMEVHLTPIHTTAPGRQEYQAMFN
jgi:hypothetical protein